MVEKSRLTLEMVIFAGNYSAKIATQTLKFEDRLDPDALTIGFARRFATYKRAYLLFKDLDRLKKIVNNEERPVQILFAGKTEANVNLTPLFHRRNVPLFQRGEIRIKR